MTKKLVNKVIISNFSNYLIIRFEDKIFKSFEDWVVHIIRENDLNLQQSLLISDYSYVINNCYLYLHTNNVKTPNILIQKYLPIQGMATKNISFGLRACKYDINNCVVFQGGNLLEPKTRCQWNLCSMEEVTVIGTHTFSPIYATKL